MMLKSTKTTVVTISLPSASAKKGSGFPAVLMDIVPKIRYTVSCICTANPEKCGQTAKLLAIKEDTSKDS